MRTLAIDYGTRRVGLALSDEGGRFASPLDVLSSDVDVIRQVVELTKREQVGRIVVGLPLNMDDTTGPAAKQAIIFGRQVAAATGVDVLFVDERLSSFDAEQQLISQKRAGRKLTRQMKKDRLDALAAASFLQAFLDGTLLPIRVD
jgi:putative holliday junction resolvase